MLHSKANLSAGLALAIAVLLSFAPNAIANSIDIRAIGIELTHTEGNSIEKAFYNSLATNTGIDLNINFNSVDVVGVQTKDILRLVRADTFDVAEGSFAEMAQDDPFLEGVDLIGVAPNLETLRKVVDADRAALDDRIQKRFHAKILAMWPYGPQVFYCKTKIGGLADLKGLKVRSYTELMSALLATLGAIPVTMGFTDVYPALQRGVADCAITSPTSGNTGAWPEVSSYYFPLGINWSVQGHFMNLDTWNKFSPDQQKKIADAYAGLETDLWNLARDSTNDASNCNVGAPSCKNFKKYSMHLVEPTAEDNKLLGAAVSKTILPDWAKGCDAADPSCSKLWDDTVGEAVGLHAQ